MSNNEIKVTMISMLALLFEVSITCKLISNLRTLSGLNPYKITCGLPYPEAHWSVPCLKP